MTAFPLSALNQYLYCPRRAWLIHAEGVFEHNEHTLLGDQAHAHVDLPGHEQRAGWTLLRALPLYSDTLALTGKADLVEIRRDPASNRITEARPIEYKKGPARPYDNDEAQLCAQALCLEEMLAITIPAGAIYHAQSQKRRPVAFDEQLRAKTRTALAALRALIAAGNIPPAELRPQCQGCSLHETCLPEAAATPQPIPDLYHPRDYKQKN